MQFQKAKAGSLIISQTNFILYEKNDNKKNIKNTKGFQKSSFFEGNNEI